MAENMSERLKFCLINTKRQKILLRVLSFQRGYFL